MRQARDGRRFSSGAHEPRHSVAMPLSATSRLRAHHWTDRSSGCARGACQVRVARRRNRPRRPCSDNVALLPGCVARIPFLHKSGRSHTRPFFVLARLPGSATAWRPCTSRVWQRRRYAPPGHPSLPATSRRTVVHHCRQLPPRIRGIAMPHSCYCRRFAGARERSATATALRLRIVVVSASAIKWRGRHATAPPIRAQQAVTNAETRHSQHSPTHDRQAHSVQRVRRCWLHKLPT